MRFTTKGWDTHTQKEIGWNYEVSFGRLSYVVSFGRLEFDWNYEPGLNEVLFRFGPDS